MIVWNVWVDVVADEQLKDIVTVHLRRVAERCATDVITSVDVSTPRQQQLHRPHPRLLLLTDTILNVNKPASFRRDISTANLAIENRRPLHRQGFLNIF